MGDAIPNGTVTLAPGPVMPMLTEDGNVFLHIIERLARDKDIDIDRLERFVGLYNDMEKQRKMAAYHAAMSAAQAELLPITRKLTNKHTNSKYADLAAIAEAADPIIKGHGFAVQYSEFKSTEPNCLGVRCKVSHAQGHSETSDFNIPIDSAGAKGNVNKTPTQAYGSTMSYGRRYAKCAVFDIATKDDTDGNAPQQVETISAEQALELTALIKETNSDLDKFLAHGKVDTLIDIRAVDFQKAKGLLLTKKQKLEPSS